MLMNIKHSVYNSTLFGFKQRSPAALFHNPPLNYTIILNSKQKQQIFPPLINNYTRLDKHENNRRKFMVYSVEPGASPSGPPPNALSWIVAVAIAIVVPFINYKWGPLLKKKIEAAMQTTEDVAEAVEKVAEMVEKVAEDIADDLPDGSQLRKAVDFVEKFAETTADDAEAIDEFIDKVQEEEEKAKSFVESLRDQDESKKPPGPPPENTNEVQEEEEKVKSFVESLQDQDESKKSPSPPPENTNELVIRAITTLWEYQR